MPFRCVCLLAIFTLVPLRAEDSETFQVWGSLVLRAHRLKEQGKPAEAIDVAKQALGVARSFGPNDPNVAATYQVLGMAYREVGNCSETRAAFSRAIAIWQKQPNPVKQHLFNSAISLLNATCECGDFAAAEKLYRVYRELLEESAAGPLDQGRLEAFKGALARGRKRYGEAEAMLRDTLRLYKELPSPPLRDIAQTEATLGAVLSQEERLPEALEHELKAVEGLQQTAPHGSAMLSTLNNVGCTLSNLGRASEAGQYLATAARMASEELGENNHFTAQILLNYSQVLKKNKQTAEAEAMLKRAKAASHEASLRNNQTVDIQDLKLGLR